MLRPTAEEIQLAEQLGIDYEGMTGPQIREAIRRAKASQTRVSFSANEGTYQYQKLYDAAQQLGVTVFEGIEVPDLKTLVETRLAEIFQVKGIEDGVRIQYAPDAPFVYKGLTALILRITVKWTRDMPYVVLHMEGVDHGRPYYAHHVALYATAIG